MKWHKLFVSEAEAKENIGLLKSKAYTINGEEVVIFRTNSGFWALENRCPHQDLPLKGANYTGKDTIECPFHFLSINLRTGVAGRGDTYKPVKSYPIQVRNDGVYVEV